MLYNLIGVLVLGSMMISAILILFAFVLAILYYFGFGIMYFAIHVFGLPEIMLGVQSTQLGGIITLVFGVFSGFINQMK